TAGGAFDPTMRAALHGPAAPSGVRNAVSSAMSTAVSTVAGAATGGDMKGADMKGADINGGDANASATDLPAMTTTDEQMSVQRAELPAPATTTTTGPREAVVGMTTTASDTPTVTEWSTSWTTNGTTVWEWWSESNG
ncbi:MAG TPA: hypothetical protein VHF06_32155, partial [Pseudonocardiaceae bacterium]|nr:hypothetical protein [Pseudonocardiaceae bacterium]